MDKFLEIQNSAKVKYNGNLQIAIAADLYGEAVIFDCNNQVPAWAETEKINEIESRINSFVNQTEQSNAEKTVSIATLPEVKDEDLKGEEVKEINETFIISDAELFQIVLDANKSNCTIGEVITKKLYGENTESINAHKVGYVKGLITKLLNEQTAEKVEESQPKEETPADANTEPKADELKAVSEVKNEAELSEVKPA